MAPFKIIIATVILFAAVAMTAAAALAEDRIFLGLQIKKTEGIYLVTKGVNVRTEPRTKAKKLGTLKAGSKVNVVGRAKGGAGWMAITWDDKDYGFVYAPAMLPLIDGTLIEKISGTVQIEGHAPCDYTFEFSGKNTVGGEDYVFSDYEVSYRCNDKGKPFRILAPMFMTEFPYKLTHKPVFQISIDLMEIENGYDQVYSTTFHYMPEQKKIVFDGVSINEMGRIPKIKERSAGSIVEALGAAVELAPNAWAAPVWRKLSEELVEGGD